MKNILLSLLALFYFSCQQQETLHLRKKVIKKIYPGIVEVVVPKQENKQIKYQRPLPYELLDFKERNDKYHSIGTAFFKDSKHLVSAAHVFAPDKKSYYENYFIRTNENEVYPIKAITRFSAYRDIIEFTLDKYPDNSQALEFQNKVEIGDMVYAVGNAQGEGISTRGGQVSTFTPEPVKGTWDFIRFSSPTSPGNSGSPLVNSKGQVVGVVVMKNGSENLNYALPIAELEKTSPKEAVFYERQLSVQDGMQTVAEDWLDKAPLPSTFKDLHDAGSKSKEEFYSQLIEKFVTKFDQLLFPNSPRFKDSLRYQKLISRVSLVQKDQALQNWHLKDVELTKIMASLDNVVYRGFEDIFNLTLLIKNETNLKTQELFNNPRRMANRMAETIGAHRTMASQQIPIVDYGEPAKEEIWRDQLGRLWKSAYWHILYNNTVVVGHFTPAPEGVYAFFDQKLYSNLSQGYMDFVKGNILEINLSYSGTTKEWKEFLDLPQDLLPPFLRKVEFSLLEKKNSHLVNLKGKDFSVKNFSFSDPEMSQITALVSYDPDHSLKSQVQGWEFLTHRIREEGTSFFFAFETPELAPDWAKERWLQIKNRLNHYDGKVHNINGRIMVKKPLKNKAHGQWWMSCFSLSSLGEKNLMNQCKALKKRVKIK